MNTNSDHHEPNSGDELHDRLLDRALAEVVGGETPPNLSALILAENLPPAASTEPVSRRRFSRRVWATLAVAAALLIAAVPLLSPQGFSRLANNLPPSTQVGLADRDLMSSVRTEEWSENIKSEDASGPENSHPSLGIAAVPIPITASAKRDESSMDASFFYAPPRERSKLPVSREEGREKNTSLSSLPTPYYLTDDVKYYTPGPEFKLAKDAAISPPGPGVAGPGPGVTKDRYARFGDGSQPTTGGGQSPPPPVWFDQNKDRQLVVSDFGVPAAGDGFQTMVRPAIIPDGEALGLRPDKTSELGTGPGLSGDQYVRIYENPFIKAEGGAAVSTFSIDVDTASYANVRRFLLQENTLPPADAVRLEELVNYFKYNYAPPISANDPIAYNTAMASARAEAEAKGFPPFAAHLEVAACPWAPEHRLVRIGIKGQEMDRRERPKSNLVFLVDVSGSMSEPSKLPLVIDGLKDLARELGENDRVAIVVYAQQEGLVLPSTPGNNQAAILGSLSQLRSGGSTAGGAGIQLAYQVAEDNFIKGGTNRVILCTDGDFNVGVTSSAELQRMVEQKAKDTGVFLSVLGFGRGNLNDQMMEAVADHGNGNYHYVDSLREARRVFVEEMSGTLVTIAKDVKIQVEFNPKQVAGYRLLGYENRMLRTEDFNDDKKDAGEIGAGHTVTALYEIVPAGKPVAVGPVDGLKYQQPAVADATAVDDKVEDLTRWEDRKAADISRELLTLKMKYKRPDADKSEEALSWALTDAGKAFSATSADFQFASSVAGFGMLLRNSQYKGNLTFAAAIELAQSGLGSDAQGYRQELVEMIKKAKQLRGE